MLAQKTTLIILSTNSITCSVLSSYCFTETARSGTSVYGCPVGALCNSKITCIYWEFHQLSFGVCVCGGGGGRNILNIGCGRGGGGRGRQPTSYKVDILT